MKWLMVVLLASIAGILNSGDDRNKEYLVFWKDGEVVKYKSADSYAGHLLDLRKVQQKIGEAENSERVNELVNERVAAVVNSAKKMQEGAFALIDELDDLKDKQEDVAEEQAEFLNSLEGVAEEEAQKQMSTDHELEMEEINLELKEEQEDVDAQRGVVDKATKALSKAIGELEGFVGTNSKLINLPLQVSTIELTNESKGKGFLFKRYDGIIVVINNKSIHKLAKRLAMPKVQAIREKNFKKLQKLKTKITEKYVGLEEKISKIKSNIKKLETDIKTETPGFFLKIKRLFSSVSESKVELAIKKEGEKCLAKQNDILREFAKLLDQAIEAADKINRKEQVDIVYGDVSAVKTVGR